jgi:uncharacterized Zn finger protein
MAENARAKGRRLLEEGRLTVERVDASGYVQATCRGDSAAVYHLGFDPGRGQWRCTCPARGRCAHLIALQLVTVQPEE